MLIVARHQGRSERARLAPAPPCLHRGHPRSVAGFVEPKRLRRAGGGFGCASVSERSDLDVHVRGREIEAVADERELDGAHDGFAPYALVS